MMGEDCAVNDVEKQKDKEKEAELTGHFSKALTAIRERRA